jgi:RimJ/RimL family protein N-acetyltransferase
VDEVGEITVRPARVDDVEGLAEVHVGGYEAAHRGLVPDALIEERTPELRRQVWRKRLAHPPENDLVLVAEADGRIVGFVSGHPGLPGDEEESELVAYWESLYIEPGMIGTDAGRAVALALVDRICERFAESGLNEVAAYVHDQNTRGMRFLEKTGFRRDGGSRAGPAGTELRVRRSLPGKED